MIRKMITIRLGDNKEGLIFDTTPVIVHLVETTRSNKALNTILNNLRTDSVCAELSRHTNTWENISNCIICNALNTYDAETGYATRIPKNALGFYASSNRVSYIINDAKWLMSTLVDSDGKISFMPTVVSTRKEFYDTDGNIYQKQLDDTDIKKAFKNKTAI